MSKGLEALERLHKFDSDLHIIYKELRDNSEDLDTIEKELKALEIIKNKKVNVWRLYTSFRTHGLWLYNNETIAREYKLTQEEWNLLKEVLL